MDNGGQNTHNVFSMNQNASHSGFAPLAQLEAYWEALRGGRLMPNRSEIDPRGIEQALEYSFIVERIAPGIARLRIAGSHLSDLMGMEVRGMPLTSFITPGSRRQLSDILEEVFETPATCTLQLHSEQTAGMPPLEARMVLMPLKSDLGDVSRILGALVSVGESGRSPRRFDVTRTSLRPIVTDGASVDLPRKAPVAKPKTPRTAPGFNEPRAQFKSDIPRQSAPYLRLVKSDD
ncbi:PAS domain-containing protein [uncultured Roseobacter sp.]|uniref:PAS domain-containing protein n=1 Tax=uncultured Roseobacter sp. TaxID=114847 RepID=UPI00261322F2|nr:PAS domain-containing protein [uncultured Roseobacter sp.]